MDSINNDLVYNVAQLMKEPLGSTRKFELHTAGLALGDSPDSHEEGTLDARDLTGMVRVTRLSRDLLVQGDVSADIHVVCSRCLDEFNLPVQGVLEEQFQPTIDVETGRPVQRQPFEEDDTAFNISANHEMDLTEPIRQSLLVALPLKPLCKDDCKGLCPQCGANLNDGPCGCEIENVDNRWAALRELKLEDLPAGDANLN